MGILEGIIKPNFETSIDMSNTHSICNVSIGAVIVVTDKEIAEKLVLDAKNALFQNKPEQEVSETTVAVPKEEKGPGA